jgi:hypothetical protein
MVLHVISSPFQGVNLMYNQQISVGTKCIPQYLRNLRICFNGILQ